MKQIRRSMRIVSVLLIGMLLASGAWLGFTVYSQGSRWLTNRYNPRLNSAKQNVEMGNIIDRNGNVIASTGQTKDGPTRKYAGSKTVRRALSQTVGDQMSMSGTGVETFHAGTLLGFSGSIIDRAWQFMSGSMYRGDDIKLTISSELSAYIYDQFPNKKHGAVAIINYKTGEVLALNSMPTYDPQTLANRKADVDSSGSAYLNRNLQGQYTPGSAFKVVTLAAALENIPDVISRTFNCTGPRMFGNSQVTCYGGAKHGKINLAQALSESCNVTFAALAYEMGSAALIKKAEQMGFNDNFSFRDLVLYQSSIPTSIPDIGELAWTGVGQGKLQVTPLHMAMISGAIANGGLMKEPKLIQQVTGVGGIPRLRAASGSYGQVITKDTAGVIGQYMKLAVDKGTATRAKVKGYTVCGKTGTAEVSNDKKADTDAWFIGYVDNDAAPYAIAIVIEKGGTGGSAAAPLAAKVLKKAISLGLS